MPAASVPAIAALALTLLPQPSSTPAPCERLASLALPSTTITLAETVAAGTFVPPAAAGRGGPQGASFSQLPPFCRVAATMRPSPDSDIKIEVWLPASGWNGKFLAVGNGGWSGAIVYAALATSLLRGYATASTDTGHSGGSGSFALGHPEKLTDFAYRAVHEMTVQAKAIIAAHYGSPSRLSYWNGCSSGGKQGLKEAQRFPADYDGIIAGAPANYWTHLVTQSLWVAQATLTDPARYVPPAKFPLINKAVLDACDRLDGVKDGLLADPSQCRFDPAALRCKGDDAPTCLTGPQVEAVGRIYSAAKNPRTGDIIFPGLAPGSELGWTALAGGPKPFSIAEDHFKFVVFKDPNWDYKTLDFDRGVAQADQIDGGSINATDPDLSAFASRGGRLLMYHGWNDQLIAPQNSIDYFTSVQKAMGAAKAAEFVRLFMAPGMTHCAGGPGPNTFDMLTLLEQWVEKGNAPTQVTASHSSNGTVDRTRPLCAYPQLAHYKGVGSIDEAASFVCQAP